MFAVHQRCSINIQQDVVDSRIRLPTRVSVGGPESTLCEGGNIQVSLDNLLMEEETLVIWVAAPFGTSKATQVGIEVTHHHSWS